MYYIGIWTLRASKVRRSYRSAKQLHHSLPPPSSRDSADSCASGHSILGFMFRVYRV